jgi:hypothetical protein
MITINRIEKNDAAKIIEHAIGRIKLDKETHMGIAILSAIHELVEWEFLSNDFYIEKNRIVFEQDKQRHLLQIQYNDSKSKFGYGSHKDFVQLCKDEKIPSQMYKNLPSKRIWIAFSDPKEFRKMKKINVKFLQNVLKEIKKHGDTE